jgi:transposase-like protein
MARPLGPRKIYRYSQERQATTVRLSQLSGVTVTDVAQSLDVHPILLSRRPDPRAEDDRRPARCVATRTQVEAVVIAFGNTPPSSAAASSAGAGIAKW